jgi:hypothetical protein
MTATIMPAAHVAANGAPWAAHALVIALVTAASEGRHRWHGPYGPTTQSRRR